MTNNKFGFVYFVLLLVAALSILSGCSAIPGGSVRQGETVVRPETSFSIERIDVTAGLGDGWGLLWVQGDEFVYCIDRNHYDEWKALTDQAVREGRSFVIEYQDGGGFTAGACTTGIEGTYPIRARNLYLP